MMTELYAECPNDEGEVFVFKKVMELPLMEGVATVECGQRCMKIVSVDVLIGDGVAMQSISLDPVIPLTDDEERRAYWDNLHDTGFVADE